MDVYKVNTILNGHLWYLVKTLLFDVSRGNFGIYFKNVSNMCDKYTELIKDDS
jgi:hypothetical protein